MEVFRYKMQIDFRIIKRGELYSIRKVAFSHAGEVDYVMDRQLSPEFPSIPDLRNWFDGVTVCLGSPAIDLDFLVPAQLTPPGFRNGFPEDNDNISPVMVTRSRDSKQHTETESRQQKSIASVHKLLKKIAVPTGQKSVIKL